MICSGKTRDGGQCSRKARFGLYCKTHLPVPVLPTPSDLLPVAGAADAEAPDIHFLDFVVDERLPMNPVESATPIEAVVLELPTLYDLVLRRIESGDGLPAHVEKSAFDVGRLGDSVTVLYKHGLRIMDNGANVLVYRPRFLTAADKAAWRAKHARIHEDRLRFLRRVEDGTRICVRKSEKEMYTMGLGFGVFVGGMISMFASGIVAALMRAPVHGSSAAHMNQTVPLDAYM